MLLTQPLEAEAVADLLVGGRREDQVAARPEPLTRERGDGDGVRRDLALHVERAAPPNLAVPQLARERRHRPLGRIGEHDIGVTHEEKRRAVTAANPGHEVRALRHLRDQLAGDAARLEVVAQQLGRDRFVAGRVRRVDADQPLQEVRDLAPERRCAHRRVHSTRT